MVFNRIGAIIALLTYGILCALIPFLAPIGLKGVAFACPFYILSVIGSLAALTLDRYVPNRAMLKGNRLTRAMLPYYADLLRRLMMIQDDSTYRIAFFGVPVALWPHAIAIAVPICWIYWSIFGGSTWTNLDWIVAISISILGFVVSVAYALSTIRIRELS